ncbi:MAG: cytochrome c oxidase accessory protein CcoG, partial [Gammaproteobacteria bacterium]|nr:cytochrome c oxidase accessory protein CcoG [Gammaproteobacteria bacterium]
PYARFQSAMFDRNTLLIAYDEKRGEPRGSRRRSADHRAQGLGDCIDCKMCVQVCPTGIDIRDGLQYTCIGCAACVDACDSVMEQVGYPKGLVRYTTQNAMDGIPTRLLRPRTLIYASLLVCIAIAAFVSVLLRAPLALDVIRDRNALFRDTADGRVENVYTLKLINKSETAHRYTIGVQGLDGAILSIEGQTHEVAGGQVLSLPASVRIDPALLSQSSSEVVFVMSDVDAPERRVLEEARFLGPRR